MSGPNDYKTLAPFNPQDEIEITPMMQLWAVEFTKRLGDRLTDLPVGNGRSPQQRREMAVALAADDAEKLFPLTERERAAIRLLCERDQILELVK